MFLLFVFLFVFVSGVPTVVDEALNQSKYRGEATTVDADLLSSEIDWPIEERAKEMHLWDCSKTSKLGNGMEHHPVLQRFWCFNGNVAAGFVAAGWLGQITPVHAQCWGERRFNHSSKVATLIYGACGLPKKLLSEDKENVASLLAAERKQREEEGKESVKEEKEEEKEAMEAVLHKNSVRHAAVVHRPNPVEIRFKRASDFSLLENSQVKTTMQTVVDNSYYELISLLAAVSRSRGSFVMIELGAGWGPWLINAYLALLQSKQLPCVLIGMEADPMHHHFMRQNFVANKINPDEHLLMWGAVATKSGEDKLIRMNPAQSYGAALSRGGVVGSTTVPTTSLHDLLSSFWIVDHIDMDIQGLEVDIIAETKEELNLKVRSIWVECHTLEVYIQVVDLFRDMEWDFLFNLPPKEMGRTVNYGQGNVELEPMHGGIAVLNPRIE